MLRWPGGDVQVAVDNGHLLDTCKPLKPVSHRMAPMQVDGGQNQLEIVRNFIQCETLMQCLFRCSRMTWYGLKVTLDGHHAGICTSWLAYTKP